ncbi:hypothetical protein Adt_27415 [Abeliophyllum distichum]|uniref:Uncharacterized protein n=1 Tax=Abeliophyllum distichum TaxID=126358 RepID=A0ABD1RTN2_9LAMI
MSQRTPSNEGGLLEPFIRTSHPALWVAQDGRCSARRIPYSRPRQQPGDNKVLHIPTVDEDEDYHDQAPPAPPPAPTINSDFNIQLAQLIAAQKEMDRAIGNIQSAVLHI